MTAHQEESDAGMDMIWVGLRGTALAGLEASQVHSVASRDVSDLVERMWLFAQMTPGETLDALISRADGALRRAKEGGRDRVEAAA